MNRLKTLWHRWGSRKIRARVRRDLEAGLVPWDQAHVLHRRLGQLSALVIHARSEHDHQAVRDLEREHWTLTAELEALCEAAQEGLRATGPRTQRPPPRKSWVFQQEDPEEEHEPLIGGVRLTTIRR
jgi:hypothetical protein